MVAKRILHRISHLTDSTTKTTPAVCHNDAEMRKCAKFNPQSCTPKNPGTPPAPGIFKKSNFCKRTQAAWDQKTTDSVPGFLGFITPSSRVPELIPGISQHQRAHTLPEIPCPPVGSTRENIKMRNEPNPTKEDPWAGGETANPASSSVFIRVVIHVGLWPKKPHLLSRITHLRQLRQKHGLSVHHPGVVRWHKLIGPIGLAPTRFPAIRQALQHLVAQSPDDSQIQQRNLHPRVRIARHDIDATHTYLLRATKTYDRRPSAKMRSVSRSWLAYPITIICVSHADSLH